MRENIAANAGKCSVIMADASKWDFDFFEAIG
jgi:hypothetical protein